MCCVLHRLFTVSFTNTNKRSTNAAIFLAWNLNAVLQIVKLPNKRSVKGFKFSFFAVFAKKIFEMWFIGFDLIIKMLY